MCIHTNVILSKVNPDLALYRFLPFILDEIGEQAIDKHILNARLHSEVRNSNPVLLGHDIGDDG